jgi:hypothetical protein
MAGSLAEVFAAEHQGAGRLDPERRRDLARRRAPAPTAAASSDTIRG